MNPPKGKTKSPHSITQRRVYKPPLNYTNPSIVSDPPDPFESLITPPSNYHRSTTNPFVTQPLYSPLNPLIIYVKLFLFIYFFLT